MVAKVGSPFRLGISKANIDATLRMGTMVRVQAITHDVVVSAVILRRRHALSHLDSAIIAAVLELGCGTVYSEAMSHGCAYDSVRIINPFLPSGA